MREGDFNPKTALDDNAAIYAKADTRSAKEKFKDLHGKEKWQFFLDYILGRIIAVILITGLLVWIGISTFGPKPEPMLHIAIIENPFLSASKDQLIEGLNKALVTDEKKQEVIFDDSYYMSSDEVSSRTKFMTFIAAGDIDCVILPGYELNTYSESGFFDDVTQVLPADVLPEDKSSLVKLTDSETGKEFYAGIPITDEINKINAYETTVDYYLVCVVNAKHPENIETLIRLLQE